MGSYPLSSQGTTHVEAELGCDNIYYYFCCCFVSFSYVKLRLYTENQLPRLPGSALKVPGGGVGSYPLSSHVPTHVEIELVCDKKQW